MGLGNVEPVTARAIEVVDLTMTYGDLRAVDGVSFEVGGGRVLRHPRPERRRQDHDAGDDRGAAPARRGHGQGARPAGLAAQPALLPRIGVQLQASSFFERLTAREQIRTFAALYGVGRAGRGRVAGAGRAGRQGRHPGRGPLRRPGAAALDRLRAGPRPRGGLPRRADRGARPAGPAQPVGPALRAQRLRPHRRADHALHGRGRGALRPGRDHGPRPDPPARHAGRAGPRPRRPGPDHRRARPARPRRGARDQPASTTRPRAPRASCSPPGARGRDRPARRADHLDGVRVQTGTLEDVFLDLTGREYRA